MITVEIKITTEAGDPVVNINQRCKENRLEEVLKAALAAFEGTDGSDMGRLVLKSDITVSGEQLAYITKRNLEERRRIS